MTDIPDILLKIVETKKVEIAALYASKGLEAVIAEAADANYPKADFKAALACSDSLSVIAEVKKASPSAGIIDHVFDYLAIARAYEQGGASAVSVLTDVDYFKGSLNYMTEIKQAISLPVLRKDFIIDQIQIYEAKAAGADAFLLIAAILTEAELKALYDLGKSLGMDVLVEVHDAEELQMVLAVDCDIIGVNNRNLRNFHVDLATTEQLSKLVGEGKILVGESGIKTAADAHRLRDASCDAVLVGESLVRSGLDKCGLEIAAYLAPTPLL